MCIRRSSMLRANNSKIRKSDTCSTRIVANNYRRYQLSMTMVIITVDGIRCEITEGFTQTFGYKTKHYQNWFHENDTRDMTSERYETRRIDILSKPP